MNPFIPIILIAWINENHYELMLPNNLQIEDIPLEYNILNHDEKPISKDSYEKKNLKKKILIIMLKLILLILKI